MRGAEKSQLCFIGSMDIAAIRTDCRRAKERIFPQVPAAIAEEINYRRRIHETTFTPGGS